MNGTITWLPCIYQDMFTIHFVITFHILPYVLPCIYTYMHILYMAMGQNPVPLVNLKIAGKSVFIPQNLIVTGFDLPHM